MPPLKPRDHRISLTDASAHTRRHRGTMRGKAKHGDHAGAFHGDQVMALLKQPGCVALRIYHGRNEKRRRSMILVGVDKDGNDLTAGTLMELCWPCPPYCGADSPLNKG